MVLNSNKLADILLKYPQSYLLVRCPTPIELLQRRPGSLEPLAPKRGHPKLLRQAIVVLYQSFAEHEDLRGEIILFAVDVDEGESLLRGVVDLGNVAQRTYVYSQVLS